MNKNPKKIMTNISAQNKLKRLGSINLTKMLIYDISKGWIDIIVIKKTTINPATK
jgi:hypothetical protein